MAQSADARLHASPAGAADNSRQTRDTVDAGSGSGHRRDRLPPSNTSLSRGEGNDGDPGQLPRVVSGKSRESSPSRSARIGENVLPPSTSRQWPDLHPEAGRVRAFRPGLN